MVDRLPNLHNVNVAECFREPATYYQQSFITDDLNASYRDFDFIRNNFGQVPGGMFGADEIARTGHTDPHQAIETCGMVEQIGSNSMMMTITADPKWMANSEDVAYNTLPAAFTEDYRALRYLTEPNMAVSDARDHSPGLLNGGPFLLMNPFSSRCCQHNSSSAWVNFLEGTWMATQDNGLAALLFADDKVSAKVGHHSPVTITTHTHYPFEDTIRMQVDCLTPTRFPLYILIPGWATGASVQIGKDRISASPGKYMRLDRDWRPHDRLAIHLPMKVETYRWVRMKDAESINYGPLTFSLKIKETFHKVDGIKNAISDSGWQPNVDPSKWPTYEILPASAWNYGLATNSPFKVVRKRWPTNDYPFTAQNAPLSITAVGNQIPSWHLDADGLAGALPTSPVAVKTKRQTLELIPMGAARLRISSFPVVR